MWSVRITVASLEKYFLITRPPVIEIFLRPVGTFSEAPKNAELKSLRSWKSRGKLLPDCMMDFAFIGLVFQVVEVKGEKRLRTTGRRTGIESRKRKPERSQGFVASTLRRAAAEDGSAPA